MSNIEQRIICVARFDPAFLIIKDVNGNSYFVASNLPEAIEPGTILVLQRDTDTESCKEEAREFPHRVGTTIFGLWTIEDE